MKKMKLAPLAKKDMPPPLPLKRLLGPSFILLGLGLGSGELILWPYLTSNFGLGIIWGAVLGITFQFFINMEVERYTLVTGESIFVGIARKLKEISPVWFILSTLIPWMWPGIAASAGQLFSVLLGIPYTPIVPIVVLLLIGIILTIGPVLYKTQEVLQKAIIIIGVPFIFILTLFVSEPTDWTELVGGVVGKGTGYWFWPNGLPVATFLAAFAYAGAGGNLNLAQSLYIKEKGYGMGKFSGRITSLLTGKKEKIALEGNTFDSSVENISKFKVWWKRINTEHLIVFWATGAITMLLLSTLAYSSVYGKAGNQTGIQFVINEAQAITTLTMPLIGKLFLLTSGVMLFFTQFSVLGSTSRIMSENLVIFSPQKFKVDRLPLFFYSFLWLQILLGIAVFLVGFTEPLTLIILGAVLNAFSMFIYSGLLLWVNRTLPVSITRPSLVRYIVVITAFLFYGAFSLFTIYDRIFK
jgi:hypothetical protein